MQINYQTNNQECGLCVLQSLIKQYYHFDIDRSQLLDESNLTTEGLSLFDLEVLAKNHGLNLESYEMEFDEFKTLKNNHFFILLLNDNNFHYVIAKKCKDKIKIYCSEKGEYTLNYEQLRELWTSIYIEVKKAPHKNFLNDKLKIESSYINWKTLIFANVVQISILLITIFNSTFFDQLFTKVIQNKELSNLLFLMVLFTTTYIIKQIGSVFISFYSYKNCFDTYMILNYKLMKKLNNKYLSFYDKVNENFIRNADDYAYAISEFYNIYLNNLIADIFSILLAGIFILMIDKVLLIIVIGYVFVMLLIEFVNYIYFKKQINMSQEAENHLVNLWNRLVFNINKINYLAYQNKITLAYNNQNLKIREIIFKNLTFSTSSGFISFFAEHIFLVLIIIMSCEYIVNQELFPFSKLTIIMNLFMMLGSSSKSIIGIIHHLNKLKYNQIVFNDLMNVDNKPINVGIQSLKELSYIYYNNQYIYNDCLISGPSGCGKTTMLYKLNKLIKLDQNDQIYFNNIEYHYFNNDFFKQNLIYLNNQSELLNENDLIDLIHNSPFSELVIKALEILQIKQFKNCSLGQKQALIFLSLLKHQHKIICLDEMLANVDNNLKQWLLINIKPILCYFNFVIYVSHDQNIKDHFAQELSWYE